MVELKHQSHSRVKTMVISITILEGNKRLHPIYVFPLLIFIPYKAN